jgi:hypothetical protein
MINKIVNVKNKEHLGDLGGKTFCDGKLTAIEQVKNEKDNHRLWKCKCNECGREDIIARALNLIQGKTGCKCSTHTVIEINGTKHKKCSKCGRVLPHNKFNKSLKYKDGLRPECRDCQIDIGMKYREENQDKIRAKTKKEKHANKVRNLIDGISKKETKFCTKCNTEKNIELFCFDIYSSDGYHDWCKDCQSEYEKTYRKNNPEKEKIRHKTYGQTDAGKRNARKRKHKRSRELGSKPVNTPVGLSNYHEHHLQLRTLSNSKIDKDKTIYIPIDIHSGNRHYPDGKGRMYRKGMDEITAAAFDWLLTDSGLSTIKISSDEYHTLLELIKEGKSANLDHIPEKYRDAHVSGIIKLENYIYNKLNNDIFL